MDYIVPATISDAQILSSNVAFPDTEEATYTLWATGQTIALNAIRRYNSGDKHWIVRALQAHTSSASNAPTGLDTDAFWVYLRDANRYRMFDSGSTSQTENANSITVSLNITEAVDALYFGNLDANRVTVQRLDINSNVVHNKTYNLVDDSEIYDAWTYFFAPFKVDADLYINDLTIYYASTLNITIEKTGSIAKCGICAIGQSQYIGFTEYGKLRWGVRSFSINDDDELGDATFVRRKTRRIASVSAMVESGLEDGIQTAMREADASAIVFIVSENFKTTYIYGFYRDFYAVATYPSHSEFNFEIEELA